MVDEGKIGVRLYVMARTSNEELAKHLDAYRMIGYGHDHLTVRAIKVVLDGALGSRSAWMLEPYSDLPSAPASNACRSTRCARRRRSPSTTTTSCASTRSATAPTARC